MCRSDEYEYTLAIHIPIHARAHARTRTFNEHLVDSQPHNSIWRFDDRDDARSVVRDATNINRGFQAHPADQNWPNGLPAWISNLELDELATDGRGHRRVFGVFPIDYPGLDAARA